MTFERARQVRLATDQRYEALSDKEKRFFETIRGVDTGNFDLKMDEARKIAVLYDGNAINASYDFFRFGFLKGQRAVKAAQRKTGLASIYNEKHKCFLTGNPHRDMAMDMLMKMTDSKELERAYSLVRFVYRRERGDFDQKEAAI